MTLLRICLGITTLACVLVACNQRAATAETARSASADYQAGTTTVDSLPLKRGYYVATDTACTEASNATTVLVRRGGLNGSQYFCDFQKIEKTAEATYVVTEACAELREPDVREVKQVTYVLQGDSAFTSRAEDGWEHSARYCEQSAMSEPWRDNDISVLD